MNILYFGAMSVSIENLLLGKTEIEGHPAFFYPMYKLIKRGHDVDFVFMSNFNGDYNVNVEWFDPNHIIANVFDPYNESTGIKRNIRRIKRLYKMYKELIRAVKNKNYDFIYAHSSIAAIAQLVGRMHGIPVGIRWYGDSNFCYKTIQNRGKYLAAIKHPLNFLNFKLPYAFLVATDDHSYADKAYEAWNRESNGPFFHWKTGVNMKTIDQCKNDIPIPNRQYIFFAARFARWKRYDRPIEVLHQLHQKGVNIDLYLAGQTTGGASSLKYIDELKALINKFGLEDYVHFMGGVSQDTIRAYSYHAVATVIMHDIAIIGNVFYETMSMGARLIVTDDGSVHQFIRDGENGFIVDGPIEGAEVVQKLMINSELSDKIRANAIKSSREMFLSADERFDREVLLIEKTIEGYKKKKSPG